MEGGGPGEGSGSNRVDSKRKDPRREDGKWMWSERNLAEDSRRREEGVGGDAGGLWQRST